MFKIIRYLLFWSFFRKNAGKTLFYSNLGLFWNSFLFFFFFIHYSFLPKSKKEDFLDFFIQLFSSAFVNLFYSPRKKILQKKGLLWNTLYLAIAASFGAWGYGSKKVDGGERFRHCRGLNPRVKTFFVVQGTLQGLETSAARSQSFNLERELPEFAEKRFLLDFTPK